MKLIYFFVLVLLLLSCQSVKNKSEEQDYVLAYKTSVLYGCMNGSNNSFNNYLKSTNDLGLFTEAEVLKHAEAETAIKLGEKFSLTIKPLNYDDAGNKVPIYSSCVSYAFSAEIDSMAKAQYKISRKIKKLTYE